MSGIYIDSDIDNITLSTTSSFDTLSDAMPRTAPSPQYRPHPKYNFVNDIVTFLVEGTRYTLHRSVFTLQSPTFTEKYLTPGTDNDQGAPITLEDVSMLEFDAFLEVVYQPPYIATPSLSTEAWASVLRLATMWVFTGIRDLATHNLERIMTDVDRIVLGHRHAVTDWLLPGYVGLCKREKAIEDDEARRMELEDVVSIAKAREELRPLLFPPKLDSSDSNWKECKDCNCKFDFRKGERDLERCAACDKGADCLNSVTPPGGSPKSLSEEELKEKVKALIPRCAV